MIKRLFTCLLLLASPQALAESRSKLEISSGEKLHNFSVEIARTPEELAQGLMNRKSLPEDQGMLFVFPELHQASFWMKNTFIPLDLIFIDEDGRIIYIFEHAEPHSLRPITCPQKFKAVLEVNAGVVHKRGIRAGDKVKTPF